MKRPAVPAVWSEPARRRRVVSFVIVVVVEALIITALLKLGISPPSSRTVESELVAFSLSQPAAAPATRKKTVATSPKKATSPTLARKTPEELPVQPVPTPNMVTMSKEDFAAADIGNLGKAAGSTGGKAAYGPGEGPGGKTLYPAEWHVEPGNSALSPYLPYGAPEGSWAMIACRTIERYHVENCFGLGESSPGLSTALRRASWQFLVKPPRVDGRTLVGAWVRIRFDFTRKPAE